jgi:NitT/TauT family transport system substrate-binding protein
MTMRVPFLRFTSGIAAIAAVALAMSPADAQTKIRVGKAQAQQFAFVPVDIGIEAGLFKKHGVDVEVSNFGGDARMIQALTADGIDVALGGGPALATIVKGAPMLAAGALANQPGTIMLVVLKDGPVKTEDDLKGRPVSVSTAGSLTYWLASELSRRHGWGPDGIKITPLGTSNAQVAALKTKQIDGMVTESSTSYRLEEEGTGHILVNFGKTVQDFHVHVIYVAKKLIDSNPEAVRGFLAGWFDTIAYMHANRDKSIEIATRVTQTSKEVAARNYDEVLPILSKDGRFNSKALAVLGKSFVDIGLLPAAPDMSKLYTEAYLPK